MIVALWTVSFLSAFAVILGYQMRQRIILVQHLAERDKLRLVCEAGVRRSFSELTKDTDQAYDCLTDTWSVNAPAFKDINVGDGVFNICYNYVNPATGVPERRWGLVDEERKVNINTAEPEVLARLFQLVLGFEEAAARSLAAAIVDWRDDDSTSSTFAEGAEDTYYFSIQRPYGAKDAPLQSVDELLLVRDVTPRVLEGLRDYITVFGTGRVNVNTAPAAVIRALGLDEALTEKIMAFRRGADEVEGTADDNYFESQDEIVAKLSAAYRLSPEEIGTLSVAANQYFVVRSSYFTATSEGHLANRKNTRTAVCVMDRTGKIFSWRE